MSSPPRPTLILPDTTIVRTKQAGIGGRSRHVALAGFGEILKTKKSNEQKTMRHRMAIRASFSISLFFFLLRLNLVVMRLAAACILLLLQQFLQCFSFCILLQCVCGGCRRSSSSPQQQPLLLLYYLISCSSFFLPPFFFFIQYLLVLQ